MKISIVIPVYNVEKYIVQCLKSIINQTHKNLEIILIDDGSTDNSGIICDNYSKKDSRIKVIHQKNKGVSVARNKGLDCSKGSYIMFVDPDDWLELNACEILLNKIEKEQSDIIIFNYCSEYNEKITFNNNYNINVLENNDIYKLQANLLAPSLKPFKESNKGTGFTWNKIINKKFLDESRVKFILENKKAIFEDVLFYYELFHKTKKIVFLNKFLYHYRVLNDSATRSFNKDIKEINKIIYLTIKNKQKDHLKDIYYNQSIYVRMINNFYLSLNVYFCNEKLKCSYIHRIDFIKEELKKDYYLNSIKEINFKYLTMKLKLYTILIRTKLYPLIIIVNKIENKIK